MDPQEILKQMIQFNKTAFNNIFTAMGVLQEQTEVLFNAYLEQSPWISAEDKKMMASWVKTYKRGLQDFKEAAEDNYRRMEEYIPGCGKTGPGKADS